MCGGPVWHHGALACAWARSAVGKVLRYVSGMWTHVVRNSGFADLTSLYFSLSQGSEASELLWAHHHQYRWCPAILWHPSSEVPKRSSQLVTGPSPNSQERTWKLTTGKGWLVSKPGPHMVTSQWQKSCLTFPPLLTHHSFSLVGGR